MKIRGTADVKPASLLAFAQRVNPEFPVMLTELYVDIGATYGIRGDIAFCQMLKETNYHRFGGDVQAGQFNYAGIGATGGVNGAQFADESEGVTAHIQHLYAYASTADVPAQEVIIDPRFNLVTRGIAVEWRDLNGRWAVPGTTYGEEIERLYNEVKTNAPAPAGLTEIIEELGAKLTGLTEENTRLAEDNAQLKTVIADVTDKLKRLL